MDTVKLTNFCKNLFLQSSPNTAGACLNELHKQTGKLETSQVRKSKGK